MFEAKVISSFLKLTLYITLEHPEVRGYGETSIHTNSNNLWSSIQLEDISMKTFLSTSAHLSELSMRIMNNMLDLYIF